MAFTARRSGAVTRAAAKLLSAQRVFVTGMGTAFHMACFGHQLIAEYAPNHIKKSVVGAGHADKIQVQAMVRRLLPGCGVEVGDAADALAAAIAHAHLAATWARITAALA